MIVQSSQHNDVSKIGMFVTMWILDLLNWRRPAVNTRETMHDVVCGLCMLFIFAVHNGF